MTILKYYFITRYNIGIYKSKNADDAQVWMDNRFNLFQRFCVPSLEMQTRKNFDWIILVDKLTPYRDVNKITSLLTLLNHKIVLVDWPIDTKFKEHDCCSPWRERFAEIALQGSEFCTQIRLDNDDCLSKYFLERVQQCVTAKFEDSIINFPYGIVNDLTTGKRYIHFISKGVSPYFAFTERCRKTMKTIYHMDHYRMGLTFKKRIDLPEVSWQMNVHTQNITNDAYISSNNFMDNSHLIFKNEYKDEFKNIVS